MALLSLSLTNFMSYWFAFSAIKTSVLVSMPKMVRILVSSTDNCSLFNIFRPDQTDCSADWSQSEIRKFVAENYEVCSRSSAALCRQVLETDVALCYGITSSLHGTNTSTILIINIKKIVNNFNR